MMIQNLKSKQTNKNLFYLIRFATIMVILSSCYNNDHATYHEKNKLNINISNIEKIKASDYFEKIEYIPLQTTNKSLISSIDKLLIKNNRIFILDKKRSEILIFNEDGQFLTKLSKKGSGPGEYAQIDCFAINTDNNNIIIIDNLRKKVFIYDDKLKFIEDFKLPKYSKFCGYFDNHLITYSDNYLENKNLHFISLKEKKNVNSFLKIDNKFRNFQSRTGGQFMTNKNGKLLFKESLSRNVYKINKTGIEDHYYVSFNSYNVPDNYFEQNKDMNKLLYNLNTGQYASYTTIPLESDMYLFFNYSFNFSKKAVLVNKRNNKIIHGEIINDIDDFAFFDPILIEDNVLYAYIDAYRLKNIMEIAMQNNLIEKTDNKNSNLNKTHKISDDDNPIIVKYYYK